MSPSNHLLRQPRPIRRRRISLGIRALRWTARLAVILSLPAAIAWWMLLSGQFALTEIVAVSSPRVEERWIRQALSDELGSNLLTLRLQAVEERVLLHPWSSEVRSRKELPNRLIVEVKDRAVAAVLLDAEGAVFLDSRGRRIAAADGATPEGALQLECAVQGCRTEPMDFDGPETGLLKKALELDQVLRTESPVFRAALRRVEILGPESFRLHSDWHPFPVHVGVEELSSRLRAFEALAPEISRRFGEIVEVDLRITGLIVVRPATVDQGTAI